MGHDALVTKQATRAYSPARPLMVLVGPPGAGKSSVGRRLARIFGCPLTDTDEIIAARRDQPCGEAFRELGEQAFRALEAEVVAEALGRPGVVSLGGGAVVHPETRRALLSHDVVWLDVSAEEGTVRTLREGSRPVLEADSPRERYQELLDERRAWYAEVASWHVRTDGRTPAQVVAAILGILD